MGWGDRLREAAEERLGWSLVERDRLTDLSDRSERFAALRESASELAELALDRLERARGGRPGELSREKHKRYAEQSRVALLRDPLAASEANLLANFAFGRGISLPAAEDPVVGKVIEEAWTDANNASKLTSFEAQRYRSNQLLTDGNLFAVAFRSRGRIRLAFLDSDEVADIVCDPDDDERPLWYVVRRKRTVWDFENDQPKVATGAENAGLKETVRYYRHWRNVDDALAERRGEAPGDDVPPLELPPDEKLAEGEVFHLRVNRIGRSQFGAPPWARSLRFFSAMNTLTESHVAMAQAASMFVAKKVQRGSPDQIARSAMSVLNQTAEIGMAKFGDAPTPGRGALPPDPGSILVENESSRMEPVALQSGSAQAQQTAQIVRAPIAAASGFGQHYMGDASSANLATATSLELPTLMTVQAWQQTMLDLLRWFTDLVVEDAVKAGRIPPKAAQPEADPQDEDDPLEPVGERDELAEYEAPEKPARLMHLSESGDAIEFERRLNRKLGYTLNAPYPGRRNLPDVTALVTQVAQTFDQGGTNIPLRRGLLHFLADAGMNLDDPAGWVEAGLPEATIDAIAQQTLQRTQVPMGPDGKALPQPPAGPGGAPAQGDPTAGPDSGEKPPNAPSVLEAARELGADVAGLWHVAAVDPLLTEGASGGDAAGQ